MQELKDDIAQVRRGVLPWVMLLLTIIGGAVRADAEGAAHSSIGGNEACAQAATGAEAEDDGGEEATGGPEEAR